MPTERMEEVEVVCPRCAGHGGERECCGHGGDECCGVPDIRRCPDCLGEGNIAKPVAPNSLTAARLRLADAYETLCQATTREMMDREAGKVAKALAALRAAREAAAKVAAARAGP